MFITQSLNEAEDGEPRIWTPLPLFTLKVTQSVPLPVAETEALSSSDEDNKYILFSHYHKDFQQWLWNTKKE